MDGYVARPKYNHTRWKEGDKVKATHPAGMIAYVKPLWDKNRKWVNPNEEYWVLMKEDWDEYRKNGPTDPTEYWERYG